jgi:hypothetical protein
VLPSRRSNTVTQDFGRRTCRVASKARSSSWPALRVRGAKVSNAVPFLDSNESHCIADLQFKADAGVTIR